MSENKDNFAEELSQLQRRFSIHRFFHLPSTNPEHEVLDYNKVYRVKHNQKDKDLSLNDICARYCFSDDNGEVILGGCRKYRSCEATVNKKLSAEIKLNMFHCWDLFKLSERCNYEKWRRVEIGDNFIWLRRDEEPYNQNPYGLFPGPDEDSHEKKNKCNSCSKGGNLCRDALPCPFFGCVTKTMVDDFLGYEGSTSLNKEQDSQRIERESLCPYKYYFPDRVLPNEDFKKENPFRFLQCYLSSNDHIRFLENQLHFLGSGFTFYDWSGQQKHTHFQKGSEDIVDIPWRYYMLQKIKSKDVQRWVSSDIDLYIQSIFQNLRNLIPPEKWPEVIQKRYREPLDEITGMECVTDGEISFFIFAWRLMNLAFEENEIDIDTQVSFNDPSYELQKEIQAINDYHKKYLFKDKFRKSELLRNIISTKSEKWELISSFNFWNELKVEGIAIRNQNGNCRITIRFFNLIEYVLNSRFLNENDNFRNLKETVLTEKFRKYCDQLDYLRGNNDLHNFVNKEIKCEVFLEDIRALNKAIKIVFGDVDQLRSSVRFPLLPYLIWRTQSEIPFCHIWFPISNQSVKSEKNQLIPRYTAEGSECVSVFTQLGLTEDGLSYPLESPWFKYDKSELMKIINYHRIYMQILSLPMIDTIMYGKHIIPRFEEVESRHKRDLTHLSRLLSDFQHIMLNSILHSLNLIMIKGSIEYAEKIFDYFDRRRTFLASLADFLLKKDNRSQDKINYDSEDFNNLKKTCLFINDKYFNPINENRIFFEITNLWKQSLEITGSCEFESYSGTVDCILENIVFNSIGKGFQENKTDNKIYIHTGTISGRNYFIIWDNGRGFSVDDFRSIKRWIDEGPNDQEAIRNKGFGYWLIGKCIEFNGGEFVFWGDSNNKIESDSNITLDSFANLDHKTFMTDRLEGDNYRVIHCFFDKRKAGK